MYILYVPSNTPIYLHSVYIMGKKF